MFINSNNLFFNSRLTVCFYFTKKFKIKIFYVLVVEIFQVQSVVFWGVVFDFVEVRRKQAVEVAASGKFIALKLLRIHFVSFLTIYYKNHSSILFDLQNLIIKFLDLEWPRMTSRLTFLKSLRQELQFELDAGYFLEWLKFDPKWPELTPS